MADPRFFTVHGPFSIADIASRIGAKIVGTAVEDRLLFDLAPLDRAGPEDLSFLDNRKYLDLLARTTAGAVIVHPDLADRAPPGTIVLSTPKPYRAYAEATQIFYPDTAPRPGIASSAVVDPEAIIGDECVIGHHVVIGAHAEIGPRCRIDANTVIGEGVVLAEDVVVGANVTLSHCLIGARCVIYPGARIGQSGFGFAPDPGGHVKIRQLGRVIIENDVEIGANTTVDRGAGPDTIIRAGTMIDNLVQIGHNVEIGRHTILAAQVGISGSSKLGDFVMAGGQVGIAGHLTVGNGARLAAKSGLMRDVAPGTTVCGQPAVLSADFFRQVATLQKLAKKRGD